eukprot:scaffold143871_cov214-Phaeocystis_antarctica.AAC.1
MAFSGMEDERQASGTAFWKGVDGRKVGFGHALSAPHARKRSERRVGGARPSPGAGKGLICPRPCPEAGRWELGDPVRTEDRTSGRADNFIWRPRHVLHA